MNTELNFQYPHPPTSEAAIAAFEKELGYRLPEDYRQFLLKYNGGDFPSRRGYDYQAADGTHMESGVIAFFGLELSGSLDLKLNQQIPHLPDNLLLIGNDLAFLLGIATKEEYWGEVYLWEYSFEGDVILLANSFNEFLDMLYDDES